MEQKDRDYIARLFPAVSKIKNEGVRDKVIQAWLHAWKQSNFPRIEDVHQFEPARDRIAYTNVEHTNQVCQACESIAVLAGGTFNLKLQSDILLAGALLHDVDKMMIFDSRTGGFTEMGRRTFHAVAGAALARSLGLPEEVAHIIEAHSERFSPHPPHSAEAVILRQADILAASFVYIAQGMDMGKVLSESLARIS